MKINNKKKYKNSKFVTIFYYLENRVRFSKIGERKRERER